MAIRIYGWRPTASPSAANQAFINPAGYTHHTIIAQEFNEALPTAGRIIAMGSWTGSFNATVRNKKWAAYLTNTYSAAGNYPLLGQTVSATLTAINYTAPGGGADNNAPIDDEKVTAGRLSRSGDILVFQGDKLMIAGLDLFSSGSKTTAIGRSYPTALSLPAGSRMLNHQESNNDFDATFIPSNPNGILAMNYRWALYAIIEENRAPIFTFTAAGQPNSTTPGISPAVFPTVTPEFQIQYTDLDRLAGFNDYPKEIQLTIFRWTGTTWTQVNMSSYQAGVHYAVPADATDEPLITLPSPSGLLSGETYRIHARGRDELNVWSNIYSNDSASWPSQVEFIIEENAFVDSLTPNGRITDTTPDFSARYQNMNPYESKTVEVRILVRSGGGLWITSQQSDPITKIVDPGDTINVTWAETEFTELPTNTDYAVEWRVVDENDVAGPWVGRTGFHTNYTPGTPTNLSPANNAQITEVAPRITFNAVDPDDTPVSIGGNLTGFVEITGPYVINGTFNADFTGWTNGSTTSGATTTRGRATDQARQGAGSAKVEFTANTDVPGTSEVYTAMQPVVEGYTYNATAWRRLGATNLRGAVGIHWYDAASSLISSSVGNTGSTTLSVWEQVGVTAEAPATATQMRIFIRGTSLTSGSLGSVWFDDVAISSGVRGVVEATKDLVGNSWYAIPDISTHVAAIGPYSYRARMYDGNLYGQWNPVPATFTMSVGPEVDITFPVSLSTIENSRPLIEWEVTGDQNRFRVYLRDGATGMTRYDSGWQNNTSARSWLLPEGVLGNVDDAVVQVEAENPSMLSGFSPPVRFLVEYPIPPAPEFLSANLENLPGDDQPSSIRLSWQPVDTASDALIGMEIWRYENSDISTIVLIGSIVGFDPGTFLDTTPKSGVQYRYYVRQKISQAGEERLGEYAEIDTSITLYAAILEVVGGEDTERVVMHYWSTKTKTLTQQQTFVYPAGGGDYIEQIGLGTGRDFNISWQVIDTQRAGLGVSFSTREQLEMLEQIYDGQYIYNYRDGMGNQAYVRIMGNPVINYRNNGAVEAEVTIQLRRVAYYLTPVMNVI